MSESENFSPGQSSTINQPLNIEDFARWMCDRNGFSFDDGTPMQREGWMWEADAIICEVQRRSQAPPSKCLDHGVGYEGAHGLGCGCEHTTCACSLEDCDEEACLFCRLLPRGFPCPMVRAADGMLDLTDLLPNDLSEYPDFPTRPSSLSTYRARGGT